MFINKYIKLFLKKRKVEKIHKLQNIYVKKYMSSNTKSLVLFIVPASNDVNGGMLSISSIFDETVKIKNIHKSEVLACTSPKGRTIFKYTKFENNLNILRFEQIQKYFNNLKKIIIHIPEFHCQNFINKDFKFIKKWLSDIEFVHFNILNQNIKLMPKTAEINKLKSFCNLLTNTTAHKAYSTQNFKDKYNIPLHHLSTFVSPERYMHKKYVYKKNIIIISPDNNENKNKIIEKIKNELSQYKIIIIKNLTYHEYKKVISEAKYSITFGEGLDGYFIEPTFSGTVSFAVKNEDFFEPDFKKLPTLYSDYDSMYKNICDKIKTYDNKSLYDEICNENFNYLKQIYDFDLYRNKLKNFYLNNFDFK